jgi:hypothetical protein
LQNEPERDEGVFVRIESNNRGAHENRTSWEGGRNLLDQNRLGRGQAEHLKPLLSDTERAPAEISFNCSKGNEYQSGAGARLVSLALSK